MAILYMDGKRLRQMFEASTCWLLANEEVLNDLNVFPVPDGDTGTNMGSTLKSVLSGINLPDASNDLTEVADNAANAALLGARGNSGVILSQLIQGFANGVRGKKRLNSLDIAIALKESYEKAKASIVDPKEGTILTVFRESVYAAYEKAKTEADIILVVDTLFKVAKDSLANTPNLLPVLKEAGVVDAGAMGFVLIVEGIWQMMQGRKLSELCVINEADNFKIETTKKILNSSYGYCTEFFIHSDEIDLKSLREKLITMGDSLVLAEGDIVVKVHIHTMHPGNVLELGLSYGTVSKIKIDNMDEQHVEIQPTGAKKKQVAFVAVALGEGVKKIFESMGCDVVIKGGQTMNPSVEEMSNAIKDLNAEHIVVLPNNGNVVFSAKQLQEVIPEKNIHVVPSKSVPEGFAAILAWNQSGTLDENLKDMEHAIGSIKTGEVTKATRDVEINGVAIKKGDIIAIVEGNIVGACHEIDEAIHLILYRMVDEDSEIVSMLYSEDIEELEMKKTEDMVAKEYKDLEIEIHHGGQPYFSIIISVE